MDAKLNPDHVPRGLEVLLTLAEQWGIGDDFERSTAVEAATLSELRTLVETVDAVPDDLLYGWLAGPASIDPRPTREYIAFTNMTMAADEARLRLKTDT